MGKEKSGKCKSRCNEVECNRCAAVCYSPQYCQGPPGNDGKSFVPGYAQYSGTIKDGGSNSLVFSVDGVQSGTHIVSINGGRTTFTFLKKGDYQISYTVIFATESESNPDNKLKPVSETFEVIKDGNAITGSKIKSRTANRRQLGPAVDSINTFFLNQTITASRTFDVSALAGNTFNVLSTSEGNLVANPIQEFNITITLFSLLPAQ